MTRLCILLITALLFASAFVPVGHAEKKSDFDAKALLDTIDDMWRGSSSAAIFSMEIKTKNWKRPLKMRSFTLGRDYSLITILEPKREQGTSTLRIKDEMWNYLPKVARTIKIPPSMLLSSWMGSHFTNDDLVKESRMSEDYNYKLTFEGKRNGVDIYEVTLIPKPNVPVVWGKIVVEVRQRDTVPLSELFYDEKGQLTRKSEFGEFVEVDGHRFAKKMKMFPVDGNSTESQSEEYTLVVTEQIKFDVPLKPEFFSLKNLSER